MKKPSQNNKNDIYKKLWAFLKPYRVGLLISLLCATISVAATLALPIYVGRAVDCMTGTATPDTAEITETTTASESANPPDTAEITETTTAPESTSTPDTAEITEITTAPESANPPDTAADGPTAVIGTTLNTAADGPIAVITSVNFPALYIVLKQMLIIIVVGASVQWLMGMTGTKISTTVVKRLRGEAFDALTKLPLSSVDAHSHGDLESRIIADADAVGDGLLLGFSQLFTGVLTIVGTIGFLFSISAHIAPIVVLLTPLSLYVARFISSHSKRFFAEQAALRGQLTEFCTERIDGARLLRAFGAGERAKEDFDTINQTLNDASMKATFYSSLTNPGSRFVNNIIYMAVCLMGALYCIAGGITIGGLTSFLSYASGYAKPFNEITGVITELQNAIVCAGRLFELKDMPPEKESGNGALSKVRGDVLFEQVKFSYDPTLPLIEDLNLTVKRGEHVAIVGPTGAGKTTMVNLLMRFYDVNSGEIKIDGTDIANVTRQSLRASFGMVLQETWLREGTVIENLVMGREDASREEVEEAARLTRAHDFIRNLPDGYDTLLSADGGTLSQGQKQLLCITRIMLSLPPMLILDEATSSIDTRTEQKIQGAFHRMMQGRTTFIVAHRLSTIRNSDLILYMEHGNVLEQGTHETLLKQNGRYANLYRQSIA